MNRIDQTFKNLSRLKQKAFIAYMTAGDPDLETTFKAISILEKAGVDIIELGIPFSDPIGDGPVNQLAAERALKKGVSLPSILQRLEKFRRISNIPIVLFSYMNPIVAMGYKTFAKKAGKAGVDGVLTVDGPFDMCTSLRGTLSEKKIHSIYLVAPTTDTPRMKQITRHSNGFTYAVSSLGVTGVRKELSKDLKQYVNRIKKVSSNPVCLGFGIGDPTSARHAASVADGVIVGSGFVKRLGAPGQSEKKRLQGIASYAHSMVEAVKS